MSSALPVRSHTHTHTTHTHLTFYPYYPYPYPYHPYPPHIDAHTTHPHPHPITCTSLSATLLITPLARTVPPPLTCLCHPHACSLTAPPHLLALWPTRMMLEALAGADLTLPYTDSGEFLVSAGGGFIGSFLGFRV